MHNNDNDKAFALILTLWVLAILSVMLLTFAFAVNLNVKNATYIKSGITDGNIAMGAIDRVMVELIYPEDKKNSKSSDSKSSDSKSSDSKSSDSKSSDSSSNSSNNDSSKAEDKEAKKKRANWYYEVLGKWYVDTKDWSVSRDKSYSLDDSELVLCVVSAEDSKFPLSKINDIKSMPQYPESIITNMKEKAKEDKKFSLRCVSQLLTIDGVEGEVYDGDGRSMLGFKNIFTNFSDGKIYVNSTNSSVLSFIPDMEVSNAESIASNSGECISDAEQLGDLIGSGANVKKIAEKWLKFEPEYFRITAYRDIDGDEISSEAVVSVKNTEIKVVFLNRS